MSRILSQERALILSEIENHDNHSAFLNLGITWGDSVSENPADS